MIHRNTFKVLEGQYFRSSTLSGEVNRQIPPRRRRLLYLLSHFIFRTFGTKSNTIVANTKAITALTLIALPRPHT